MIRSLWRGDTVDHSGLVVARRARVYLSGAQPPPLFAAAIELGFDAVMLHNVGLNQSEFIEAFGAGVLPRFDLR